MHEKILLVDDDVSILLLVSDVLEEKGLEVTAVRSGEEALRRVEEGRFDLILLDIMMKGLSGLEVCRQIRGQVDCPILFLSAKDSVKDIVKGLDLGADDYLTKPFALEAPGPVSPSLWLPLPWRSWPPGCRPICGGRSAPPRAGPPVAPSRSAPFAWTRKS